MYDNLEFTLDEYIISKAGAFQSGNHSIPAVGGRFDGGAFGTSGGESRSIPPYSHSFISSSNRDIRTREEGGEEKPHSFSTSLRDAADDMWTPDKFKDESHTSELEGVVIGAAEEAGCKITISNLHNRVDDEDIIDLFQGIGKIRSASVHYDRLGYSLGTAAVIYESRGHAQLAMRQYNGAVLDGLPMAVKVDNPPSLMTAKVDVVKLVQEGRLKDDPKLKDRAGSSRAGSSRSESRRAGSSRSESSRAGSSRSESRRAGSSRSESRRAGSSRAGSSRTGSSRTGSSRTGSSRAGSSRAESSRTGSSRAKSSRAGSSRAESSRAGSSRAESSRAGSSRRSGGRAGDRGLSGNRAGNRQPSRDRVADRRLSIDRVVRNLRLNKDRVWNRIVDRVGNRIGDRVVNRIGDRVGNRIWDRVGDRVGDQVGDQVGNRGLSRDQVGIRRISEGRVGDRRQTEGRVTSHERGDQSRRGKRSGGPCSKPKSMKLTLAELDAQLDEYCNSRILL